MTSDGLDTQLKALGFERLSRWIPHKEKTKLESLSWKECAGWIYAFVAQGRVRYVGITTMVLRSRIDAYRDMKDDRVRRLILDRLANDEDVELYGLRRPQVTPIDLEKEESGLIKLFGFDWNIKK